MKLEFIKKIREFNRYYTVWLNVFTKSYLGTEFSWPESRVLFEIWLYPGINATELCRHLNMNKSYISRIIAKFEKNKFIARELVVGSKGVKKLWLTKTGEQKAREIDTFGNNQIVEKLQNIDEETCQKLCEAMKFIENTLKVHQQ